MRFLLLGSLIALSATCSSMPTQGSSGGGAGTSGGGDASGGGSGATGGGSGSSGGGQAGGGQAGGAGGGMALTCARCTTWGPANPGLPIQDAELVELSGLAASRAHPGVLWAHNDSGDTARFFAVSDTGKALGRFELPGATAIDWEDIALGPCPAGTCVYLADIGDNALKRGVYTVYRVTEPNVAVDAVFTVQNVQWDAFSFQYPGGEKNNAETLMVHPTEGDLYVVSKENAGVPSRVFRFPRPLDSSTTVTLVPVATLTVPGPTDSPMTGGDINPCGNAILLRMYNRLVELRLAPGAAFETIFTAMPREVPVAPEVQGEAVTWAPDGRGYATSSEKVANSVPSIDLVGCQD